MDVTYFLTKYLSGKQNVMVVPHRSSYAGFSVNINEHPSTGKEYYQVNVPEWDSYHLPVKGFDKYRIYREGVWHESQHIAHTPRVLFKTLKGATPLRRDILNITEDRRIEDLGVEEWRGYVPERTRRNPA